MYKTLDFQNSWICEKYKPRFTYSLLPVTPPRAAFNTTDPCTIRAISSNFQGSPDSISISLTPTSFFILH